MSERGGSPSLEHGILEILAEKVRITARYGQAWLEVPLLDSLGHLHEELSHLYLRTRYPGLAQAMAAKHVVTHHKNTNRWEFKQRLSMQDIPDMGD